MKLVAFAKAGLQSRHYRLSVLGLLALSFVLVAVFCTGCGDDDPVILFPEQPDPAQNNWLHGVFGTGPDDIYACGNKGAIFHYDGTSWNLLDVGVSSALISIWGPGNGTLYACGHNGVILVNSGSGWSKSTSGTSEDLYGIGDYQGQIHACGKNGALRRLSGGSWSGTLTQIIQRDPQDTSPTDTLSLGRDIASLTCVSYYAIGGAYNDPLFEGEPVGVEGTLGMVLGEDPEYDWRLRPIKGSQLVENEWVVASLSDSENTGLNYLCTTEGWLFRLTETEGNFVWNKLFPQVTENEDAGIRGMWLDGDDNLFMVTDEGQIVRQTEDFDYIQQTGSRSVLYDTTAPLVGIWGSDASNFYVVGWMDGKILSCSYDEGSNELTVEEVEVTFPAGKSSLMDPSFDEIGRLRR